MTDSRLMRLAARFGLTVTAVLVTCGVVEAGLRLAGYHPLAALDHGRGLFLRPSPNADLKYELVPGAAGFAWGTDVAINAQGFRGREAAPAPYGGFRVIALGDSITFGNNLPVEAAYPSRLQELLDPSAAAFEVLNFGVGDYDVIQEVALLEQRGLSYEPDLVVLGLCLNDVHIASPNLAYIERVRLYQSNPLLSWSRLAQFVVSRIDRTQTGLWMEEKNSPEVFARDYADRIAPIGEDEVELQALMQRVSGAYPTSLYGSPIRIGRLRYAFEWLARLAAREAFAVVVVPVPWLDGETGDYPHRVAHDILNREARRVGFDVVDVVQEFMAANPRNLRINDKDFVQPNDQGHRILATALAQYVRTIHRTASSADAGIR